MRAYVIGAFVLTASWVGACGGDDEGEDAANTTDGGGSGGTAGSSTGGGSGAGGRGSGGTPSGGTGNTGGTPPDGSIGSGGSGDASTDGGAPEGSVGDATIGADGAAPVDAGACAVLEACCDTVQAIFEASCRQSAATSTAQECSVLQGFFCGATAPDGAGPPQADAGSCIDLQACCDQLTGMQQTQCNTVVGIGIAFVCDAQMATYCP